MRAFLIAIVSLLFLAGAAAAQTTEAEAEVEAEVEVETPAEAEAPAEAGAEVAAETEGVAETEAIPEAPAELEAPAEATSTPPAETTIYAPPPGANAYPVPERTLPRERPLWPRPKQFGFMVAYAPSIGVGSSSEFASNFGYRGFAFGLRYFINEDISVGLESGWAYQDDKKRTTVTLPTGTGHNVTITTGNLRFTEIIPITVTGHYYLDAGSVVPFAGLGLGAYYTRRDLDAGSWYLSNDGWHFGFAPEIGLIVPTGTVSFFVSSRFNYVAAGSNNSAEELFFDFRIGIFGF